MHINKVVIVSFLSFAMALSLAWLGGASLYQPGLAYADVLFTPTPPPGKPEIPPNTQDAPLITDFHPSTQPSASLVSPNSIDDILNGDFENGRDGSWVEYSQNGWVRIRSAVDLPVSPHGGTWAVWLGGDYSEVSSVSQSVAIPVEAKTLRYWYWIGSQDACGYDFGHVKINDVDLVNIDLCSQNNTGGWVQRTEDISAFSGTTVNLVFQVETDSSLNSNLFLDDVTLQGWISGAYYLTMPLIDNAYWSGYFDDFSDPSSGWASGDDATKTYRYLNGEYQIYLKRGNDGWAVTPDLVLPADFRIEVDARKVSSGVCSYGFIFGARWSGDSYETYQILIRPVSQEFYVNKRTLDGTWTEIQDWTFSSAINQGNATNHIRVDRIGTQIIIYMNGTMVFNIFDGSFTGSGRDAGIRAYSYQASPVDVRFDNFSASRP
jgi:hypothetical protein